MQPSDVESVWDYPRPPALEPTTSHLRVVHGGVVVAEARRAYRVLETSHPPVFYIAPADVDMRCMRRNARSSFCEWKGAASYWDLVVGEVVVANAAWSYASPSASFAPIAHHLAFYASRVDECTVDGEKVIAQPGDFYGGWITSKVKGPFKGGPGSSGW